MDKMAKAVTIADFEEFGTFSTMFHKIYDKKYSTLLTLTADYGNYTACYDDNGSKKIAVHYSLPNPDYGKKDKRKYLWQLKLYDVAEIDDMYEGIKELYNKENN